MSLNKSNLVDWVELLNKKIKKEMQSLLDHPKLRNIDSLVGVKNGSMGIDIVIHKGMGHFVFLQVK